MKLLKPMLAAQKSKRSWKDIMTGENDGGESAAQKASHLQGKILNAREAKNRGAPMGDIDLVALEFQLEMLQRDRVNEYLIRDIEELK